MNKSSIEQCFDLTTMLSEEVVGGTMKGMEEAEEEDRVEATKVEFGVLIVEFLSTLAMSAQSGKTKTTKRT
ncbi:hypothetical protein Hdeb2414_s0003g00098681 [Helianthus debilis subsp. tardiflorus]